MRQNLIPWVALDAELEIAVPDPGRDAQPNQPGRHMVVKTLTSAEEASPGQTAVRMGHAGFQRGGYRIHRSDAAGGLR